MFDRENWYEIYVVLSKNKIRTLLTAFGVSWGIFMLLVMMGAGNGLRNGVMRNFGDFATNSVFMWTQRTTIPYKGFPQGRFFNFRNSDTEAMQKEIPEIKYLAPRNQLGGYRGANNVVRGLKTGAFSIYGEMPVLFKIQPVKLKKGRLINEIDIEDKRKVTVIGARVYESLFEIGEEPIGERIQINGVYFTVVGVLEPPERQSSENEESESIYIPFTTFQKAFNYGDIVGWYAITSIDNVPVSVVEEKALKLLAKRHRVSPDDDQAFGHWNSENEFNKIMGLFTGISVLVWMVGLGTLLAGVIGVSNIMLVIVKERTKEMGIKRALGARPSSIIKQIIMESIIITAMSGIAGLIAGVFTVEGIAYALQGNESEMFANPEVKLSLALWSVVVLMISGVFAGLLPARKAVSIKPIDALRSE